jgi:hypothetical protein
MQVLDRRVAAFHEAGHFTLGQWVGVRDHAAWVGPIPTSDPENEKSWGGHYLSSIKQTNGLSAIRRMMVASAGGVAEALCFALPNLDDFDEYCATDVLEDGASLSPADWHLAGCDPRGWPRKMVRATERAITLLRGPLLTALKQNARTLMRSGQLIPTGLPAATQQALQMHLRVVAIQKGAPRSALTS